MAKKYTLPSAETIVSAEAFQITSINIAIGSGATVRGCWLDGSANVLQDKVITLDDTECTAMLNGYNSGTDTIEEHALTWLSSNGKLTGGGTIEDL